MRASAFILLAVLAQFMVIEQVHSDPVAKFDE